MNVIRWTMLALLAVSVLGCRKRLEPPPTAPLTVEAWKSLPPETKFDIGTLERLKQGEPKLQDDQEWDRFARSIVIPAQRKEAPKGALGT